MGLDAHGIELLPIGQQIIEAKRVALENLEDEEKERLREWAHSKPWKKSKAKKNISELKITAGAYPEATRASIEQFLAAIEGESEKLRQVLFFALLCILESISFTRKDGQYLRWDHRSERRQGTRPFNKGHIPSFDEAMGLKLGQISSDLIEPQQIASFFSRSIALGNMTLSYGSCLDVLPTLQTESYDGIVTSPPYCNRYDYTRTYALELALLGVNERELIELRQAMLSCTVENRSKDLIMHCANWMIPVRAAEEHPTLKSLLDYLEEQKRLGELNNNGIPRMVRGYFYEMSCVIAECFRTLKKGAPLIMVNDNVRYAGASVPVDLILSDIAEKIGFEVDKILVLPKGKGNSSQQMGAHGRDQLRKCVYVWKKP
jgi:DNA modification methylase